MKIALPSLLVLLSVLHLNVAQYTKQYEWQTWGGGIENTHFQQHEHYIRPCNVHRLEEKWSINVTGDMSAIPTFKDGRVFFPDWEGFIYAVDFETGQLLWKTNLANFTGLWGVQTPLGYTGSASRNSPLLVGDKVIVADINTGYLFALNQTDGSLVWSTLVESHPAARGTSSPVEVDGIIYFGMSSKEEQFAAFIPGYPCCTFRGSMNAIHASNGSILWRFFTVPSNGGQPGGFAGAAVWGHNPTVDTERGLVFFTTGNNYAVPANVSQCQLNDTFDHCSPPDNHVDSIVAVNINNGQLAWARNFATQKGIDAWTYACVANPFNNPTCPNPTGPDYGFGQSPMIFEAKQKGKRKIDVVGAGSKSGLFVTLNRDNGDLVWSTYVGPGGTLGGIQWGAAVDDDRVYTALTNNFRLNYTLVNGSTWNAGSWSALDKNTGKILWQTGVPGRHFAMGPITVTGSGVLFAGSTNPSSTVEANYYALDAKDGSILWSFNAGGSVNTAPTVVKGHVLWGCGYEALGIFSRCRTFRSFEIPQTERGCYDD